MKNIINIINFVRADKPNSTTNLIEPFENQMALLRKYQLPSTFLLMHGVLIKPEFLKHFKNTEEIFEIGIWFEVDEWLARAAGLEWKGRFPWDWHVNVGFLPGYEQEDRIKLIDTAFEAFKREFGKYPKSVGSWLMDAFSMQYMSEKYGIDAFCICKEQWGTDGYSLWGGYPNQAYFPSKKNMLSPAQTKENQINTPCFRMLGADPIYSYDNDFGGEYESESWQKVITGLEPYIKETGGNPTWVDWFMKECFGNPLLSFGYAQVGQENSFGWPGMQGGIEYQFKKVYEMQKEGLVDVEKLAESGRWYKNKYEKSAPSVYSATSDWKGMGRKSVWFQTAYYRANIFVDKNRVWIRDIYRFCEDYPEKHLKTPCPTPGIKFGNLPVVDGYLWSGGGKRAGLYIYDGDNEISIDSAEMKQISENELHVVCQCKNGKLKFLLKEKGFQIVFPNENCSLKFVRHDAGDTIVEETEKSVYYNHDGFKYKIELDKDEKNMIFLNFCNETNKVEAI